MSRSKVGHNNNGEEGRRAQCSYVRIKAYVYCVCVCVCVWMVGLVDVVLGQTLTPTPLRWCTEVWRRLRMDVKSKVDSYSSKLKIIRSLCTVPHYTHTHKHKHTHTRTHTHVDTNRLLSQIKNPSSCYSHRLCNKVE